MDGAVIIANLLEISPGRIDYLAQNEIEHPLPVINIYTKSETKILAEKNVAYAKKGVFSEEQAIFSFEIPDLKNTEDFLFSFRVKEADGPVRMFLNGDEIYNAETINGESLTINLPSNLIKENNEIVIKASSPGVAFWATNEVLL